MSLFFFGRMQLCSLMMKATGISETAAGPSPQRERPLMRSLYERGERAMKKLMPVLEASEPSYPVNKARRGGALRRAAAIATTSAALLLGACGGSGGSEDVTRLSGAVAPVDRDPVEVRLPGEAPMVDPTPVEVRLPGDAPAVEIPVKPKPDPSSLVWTPPPPPPQDVRLAGAPRRAHWD
jgi:hypothetical protein